MTIGSLRKNIDQIDNKLINLLNERMNCIEEIAKLKETNNMPIYNFKRENFIFNKISSLSLKHEQEISTIYNCILDVSKNFQKEFINKQL